MNLLKSFSPILFLLHICMGLAIAGLIYWLNCGFPYWQCFLMAEAGLILNAFTIGTGKYKPKQTKSIEEIVQSKNSGPWKFKEIVKARFEWFLLLVLILIMIFQVITKKEDQSPPAYIIAEPPRE